MTVVEGNSAHGDPRVLALYRMLELTILLHQDATRSLTAKGLTTSRAPVLWQLRTAGASTQRTLADALGVSPRNITQLVDALERTGFVTREPHPNDRRATLVTLTARATEVIESLEQEQAEFVGLLFDDMPAHRLDAFTDGLDHVVHKLHELGLAADPADEDTP